MFVGKSRHYRILEVVGHQFVQTGKAAGLGPTLITKAITDILECAKDAPDKARLRDGLTPPTSPSVMAQQCRRGASTPSSPISEAPELRDFNVFVMTLHPGSLRPKRLLRDWSRKTRGACPLQRNEHSGADDRVICGMRKP